MSKFYDDYKALLLESQVLKKDTENPFYKSKYVQLKDVLDHAKNICTKHNFIFIQYPVLKDCLRCLKTELIHESGEKIEAFSPLSNIDDPQKVGASITYMRRYSLTSLLGIEEEDDDGNSLAKAPQTSSKAQQAVSQDDIQMRKEIGNWLMEIQGDKESAQTMLENITRFKGKDGKTVDGVRETDRLKGMRLTIAHEKIRKEYEEFKGNE